MGNAFASSAYLRVSFFPPFQQDAGSFRAINNDRLLTVYVCVHGMLLRTPQTYRMPSFHHLSCGRGWGVSWSDAIGSFMFIVMGLVLRGFVRMHLCKTSLECPG